MKTFFYIMHVHFPLFPNHHPLESKSPPYFLRTLSSTTGPTLSSFTYMRVLYIYLNEIWNSITTTQPKKKETAHLIAAIY